jgi:hypothetical protein
MGTAGIWTRSGDWARRSKGGGNGTGMPGSLCLLGEENHHLFPLYQMRPMDGVDKYNEGGLINCL